MKGPRPGARDGETQGKGGQAALAPSPSYEARDGKQSEIPHRGLRKALNRWSEQERPVYEKPPGGPPAEYLPVMGGRTFVGAGITQKYEFVTDADPDYSIAMVLGRIVYMRSRSRLAWLMTPLARWFTDLADPETSVITTQHTVAGVVVLEPTAGRPNEGSRPMPNA
jgi:hypothetical protein